MGCPRCALYNCDWRILKLELSGMVSIVPGVVPFLAGLGGIAYLIILNCCWKDQRKRK